MSEAFKLQQTFQEAWEDQFADLQASSVIQ